MPKIVFTGGGTAGHVTLNLALIPWFISHNWQISYIGTANGIEQELIKKFPEVAYYAIPAGKLRRYFSWQNFIDALKVPLGCIKAYFLIRKLNPDLIFSKGGFVSFPVVVGGFLNKKKIFMHESDFTPGLANKLSLPFVSTFFTTFPETSNAIKDKKKAVCVGPVLSNRLFNGSKEKAVSLTRLNGNKPIFMVIGGSLGAKSLNDAIKKNLDELLKHYQIIHITGKNGEPAAAEKKGYAAYEYVDEPLKDLLALADIVVSRAGSNSIFELASLKKPMILVPLPAGASRGEQTLNAENFKAKGYAEIIKDEDINNPDILIPMLDRVYENRQNFIKNMQDTPVKTTSVNELCQIMTKK